jgi:hypothetical protein
MRRGGRARAIATVAGACLAGVVGSAVAQPDYRLDGSFQMTGRVTVADHVRGERVGELVHRTWAFTPLCATGPCAQVRLVRSRATGADTLILTQSSPGHFAGSGRFFAPLKCAGTVYPSGVEIPFRVTVGVTETATAADGTVVATGVDATYVNTSRLNLTPCVFVPGHDSARYSGSSSPAS